MCKWRYLLKKALSRPRYMSYKVSKFVLLPGFYFHVNKMLLRHLNSRLYQRRVFVPRTKLTLKGPSFAQIQSHKMAVWYGSRVVSDSIEFDHHKIYNLFYLRIILSRSQKSKQQLLKLFFSVSIKRALISYIKIHKRRTVGSLYREGFFPHF